MNIECNIVDPPFFQSSSPSRTSPQGRFLLVDLAGSERREDATQHSKERIEEMKKINFSLSCLKECMQGGRTQPSYRRSKLTHILKPFLVPKAKSMLILISHINPMRSSLKHTINTLEYTASLVSVSRATKERAGFVGVDAWSPVEVSKFIHELQGGRVSHLSSVFSLSGKLLAGEWIGDLVKRVVAIFLSFSLSLSLHLNYIYIATTIYLSPPYLSFHKFLNLTNLYR